MIVGLPILTIDLETGLPLAFASCTSIAPRKLLICEAVGGHSHDYLARTGWGAAKARPLLLRRRRKHGEVSE